MARPQACIRADARHPSVVYLLPERSRITRGRSVLAPAAVGCSAVFGTSSSLLVSFHTYSHPCDTTNLMILPLISIASSLLKQVTETSRMLAYPWSFTSGVP